MTKMTPKRVSGFSLVELLIAMAVGMVVLSAIVSIFIKANDAAELVGRRAEMQQNARTAMNIIARDISLAGAGLPTGGVQLPSGNGAAASRFATDQSANSYVKNFNWPSNNHMFSIIPGPAGGVSLTVGSQITDVLTVTYIDDTFPLSSGFVITFPKADGTQLQATAIAAQNPPPINNPGTGLALGDVILVTNQNGSAVGEITNITNAGLITFANNDALNLNQSGAQLGNIAALIPAAANTTATRIRIISYFIQLLAGPDGVAGTADDVPRLMRQVNGQTPYPVAENIDNLQFTYDIVDDTGAISSNRKDPLTDGFSLNQVRKVNVWISARSTYDNDALHFQGINLATSVSARNNSFRDRYQ
jgi:type II secretory pathway pseudopilin PulG